jgi:hypothetical protein
VIVGALGHEDPAGQRGVIFGLKKRARDDYGRWKEEWRGGG